MRKALIFLVLMVVISQSFVFAQTSICGIGANLVKDPYNKKVFVLKTFPNSMALKYGLPEGAEIISVNDRKVKKLDITEVLVHGVQYINANHRKNLKSPFPSFLPLLENTCAIVEQRAVSKKLLIGILHFHNEIGAVFTSAIHINQHFPVVWRFGLPFRIPRFNLLHDSLTAKHIIQKVS